jgi:hypothetical protein
MNRFISANACLNWPQPFGIGRIHYSTVVSFFFDLSGRILAGGRAEP